MKLACLQGMGTIHARFRWSLQPQLTQDTIDSAACPCAGPGDQGRELPVAAAGAAAENAVEIIDLGEVEQRNR